MDGDAEIGAAGVGIELVQRHEIEDVAGIDRIGVAQPRFYLGHRELAWARSERRPRRRGRQRAVLFGLVDLVGRELHRLIPSECPIETSGAQHRIEPQEPARRHGWDAILSGGAGQHHLGRPERLGKVVRGDADRTFGNSDPELPPHLPRHPGIVFRSTRPAALVEPAEDEQVGVLQARFDEPPDR